MNGSRNAPAIATIKLRAYAKLNLYLAVLDRRPDGYHDIETIFQTIGLADDLTLTQRDGEPTLSCGIRELEGDENLALRAARLLRERYAPGRGVHIALTKRIPVAAGLGGGSADAAAVLVGLNEAWALGLTRDALREIALELGSDVPYLVDGGTVAATGRGEILRGLDPMRETWFVLLHPPLEVSAARVYNHENLKKSSEERIDGTTMTFRNILETLARGALPDVLHNAMESAVFSEFPDLAVLKQRLLDSGCAGALMSGSGATLYGLCKDRQHAESIAKRFPELPKSIVPSVGYGVEIVD